MTLWLLAVVSLAAALAASALLSRRSAHRPALCAFAIGLVIDIVVGWPIRDDDGHVVGGWGLAAHLGMHRPWSALERGLYHLSNVLVTAWPMAVAALAWWTLASAHRRRVLPILVACWGITNIILLAGPIAPDRAQHALLVVEVVSVVASFVAGAVGWTGSRWRATQGVAVALAGAELVVLLAGPFRYSVFERWDLAQICYVLSFVALAVAQVIAWRRLRPPQAGPSPS